jgi:hypothetical protein
MIHRRLFATVLAAFGCLAALGEGATPVLRQKALVGLSKVAVVIEPMHTDVASLVTPAAQLRTEVLERLRKAGLQPTDDTGAPYICVTVNSQKTGEKSWVFAIDVAFRDLVRLDRDATISAVATTWKRAGMLALDGSAVAKVHDSVLAFVEEFALDYTASNVKGTPAHAKPAPPKP